MTQRVLSICLAALALSSAPLAQGDTQAGFVCGDVGKRLDAYLERLAGLGFAGVAGASWKGEVVLEKGYGLRDRESGDRMTPETVFTVGSITKQFTAAAILELELDGKLSVTDPITHFFDDVPADKAAITLHQLLTHTSGLRGGVGGDFDLEATADWVLARAFELPLDAAPGARHAYSNLGYTLLGLIIERVSGRGYEDYLVDELFLPSGMSSTGYLRPKFASERLAQGYRSGERWGTVLERPMLPDGPCWNLRANGGVHSTAGDMLRWNAQLDGEALFPRAVLDKFFEPHAAEPGSGSSYAYGWSISRTPWDTKLVSHNGGNGTFFADNHRYVEDGLTLFVATGLAAEGFGGQLSRALRDVALERPVELPPKTLAPDALSFERYVGDYRASLEGADDAHFRIEPEAGRLVVRPIGAPAGDLLGGRSELRSAKERALRVADAFLEGDFSALYEPFAQRYTPDELDEEFATTLDGWVSEFGFPEGVETIAARTTARATTVALQLAFENGRAVLQVTLDGGDIVALQFPGEMPFESDSGVVIFPESATDFFAWSMRSGTGARFVFELDERGVARALQLSAPRGDVRLERSAELR